MKNILFGVIFICWFTGKRIGEPSNIDTHFGSLDVILEGIVNRKPILYDESFDKMSDLEIFDTVMNALYNTEDLESFTDEEMKSNSERYGQYSVSSLPPLDGRASICVYFNKLKQYAFLINEYDKGLSHEQHKLFVAKIDEKEFEHTVSEFSKYIESIRPSN